MQKRPYVICHMSPSIDGKIVSKNWPSLKIAYAAYERTATTLAADAWIVGRVSMAPYAGKSRVPRLTRKQRMPRRISSPRQRRGRTPSPSIRRGTHVAIECHRWCTRDNGARRTRVRRLPGVSRIQGRVVHIRGSASIDLRRVLAKLRTAFGIRRCCSKAAARSMGHSSPPA